MIFGCMKIIRDTAANYFINVAHQTMHISGASEKYVTI